MSGTWRSSSRLVRKIPIVVIGLVLVGALIADTEFLSPQASAQQQPAQFDPKAYAATAFPKVSAVITQKATDLATLAPAVDADLAAAGTKYGNNLGAGQYAFPVSATGTVSENTADFLVVAVPGMPAKDVVRIPLAYALNGIPVRDATGTIKFGDFRDQTAFQSVANEFKILMQSSVLAPVKPATLKGKRITVIGAWGSGGPPNSYIIQPVSIKVLP
jgi:predicted lipoprotein